ncbi:MAG: hypothetical protein KatS3mg114_1115 [Planctomycetaceae bacterium]|nr:MAG: hypothetical protein KatS3mg114_1115 [Planctomycetaceae bacterium]
MIGQMWYTERQATGVVCLEFTPTHSVLSLKSSSVKRRSEKSWEEMD